MVEAAVIGIPDLEFGAAPEGVRRAAARHRHSMPTRLRDYVRANLARYKVPREVEFVDELPRNGTGKVMRRELEQR